MESLGGSGGASGGRAEELLSGVGSRVREARRAREMTLEALASASGVSVAHLSRFESGARQPSLATLLNVAAGLGVPISGLLEGSREPGPGTVVRGAEAPFYEGPGMRFQPLVPEAGPAGLAAIRVIFPSDREEREYHRHEGEEWLYVLSGRLRLTLGGESTVLEPGDAAFFDGMLPHSFEVLGGGDVEMLMVAAAAVPGGAPVRAGRPVGRTHPLHEGHRAVGERSQPSEEV